MMDDPADRTIVSLKLGARIGMVIAALMLVVAGYHLWAPVDITGRGGLQFKCGSVIHPPSGALQVSTCGGVIDRQRMIVVFTAIGAFVVAAGSIYAFGTNRRRESRLPIPSEPGDARAAQPGVQGQM